jgi:hypothetical protein
VSLAMARVTALSSTAGAVGNAFGAAVSGGIWTSKATLLERIVKLD